MRRKKELFLFASSSGERHKSVIKLYHSVSWWFVSLEANSRHESSFWFSLQFAVSFLNDMQLLRIHNYRSLASRYRISRNLLLRSYQIKQSSLCLFRWLISFLTSWVEPVQLINFNESWKKFFVSFSSGESKSDLLCCEWDSTDVIIRAELDIVSFCVAPTALLLLRLSNYFGIRRRGLPVRRNEIKINQKQFRCHCKMLFVLAVSLPRSSRPN